LWNTPNTGNIFGPYGGYGLYGGGPYGGLYGGSLYGGLFGYSGKSKYGGLSEYYESYGLGLGSYGSYGGLGSYGLGISYQYITNHLPYCYAMPGPYFPSSMSGYSGSSLMGGLSSPLAKLQEIRKNLVAFFQNRGILSRDQGQKLLASSSFDHLDKA